MKSLPSLVVSAVTTFDGKALAKGAKEIGGLQKTVKNLAKTFGVTFGAAAMISYGRNAVKAFAENEKSAKRLETVLKNIGLGFETSGIEKNLDEISAKFGLEGEVLREAFQGLITVTGSATQAQDLLNLSLDVAAGSGQDLLTVNRDLAALYVGNTKGLRKYNLGLAQSELKTLGFNDAVDLLTKNFSGAASAELETYAGKMRVLKEAADNAQESIGTGLVTAFEILAGDGGIGGATDAITEFGNTSRDVLIGTASYVDRLISKLGKLGGKGNGLDLVGMTPILGGFFGKGGVVSKLGEEGRRVTNKGGTPFGDTIKQAQDAAKNAKARAAAEAAAAKRAKELLALQKKASITEKNKLSLSKAAAEFDTNRISIAAALRATYDKDTRLRLEALMAIEDEDGDKALDRLKQLGILTKANQTDKLNGLKGITETELSSLNIILLADLAKIEVTKNARLAAIDKLALSEADKDKLKLEAIAKSDEAEAAAFAKYNDALTKQGGLNDLKFYKEETQITTLEIMRLASIEKTQAAQTVADLIALASGLKTIEEIAAKRKAAQEADDKALAEAAAVKKAAEDKVTSDYFAALTTKSTAAITADANLTKIKLDSIASVAAAEAAANAAALAGVGALGAAYAGIAASAAAAMAGVSALSAAIGSLSNLPYADADSMFPDLGGGLYIDPGLVNPGGGSKVDITINAGVIASQDELAVLVQETIQTLNRNGDPLFTAGAE